jgi:hypothetical protein
MKRLAAVGLLAALTAALVGPAPAPGQDDKDRKKAEIEQVPYYPLEKGDVWHYKVGENRYAVRVKGIETVGKYTAARLEFVRGKKDTVFNTEFVALVEGPRHQGKFLARIKVDRKEAKPPVLFLRVNPKKDDKGWFVESKIGDQLIKGTFVQEVEERGVTVPAGAYKRALKVTAKDLAVNGVKSDVTWYFVENVGMVKQEVLLDGKKIEFELEKFERARDKKKEKKE